MLKSVARPSARLKPSRSIFIVVSIISTATLLFAQNPVQPLAEQPIQRDTLNPAPNRAPGEGFGPYKTMVVRGAMLIDGTGGPPRGPVDIVVNGNRITQIRNAGTPGMPLRPNRGPQADHEIDATGMYVMPGFVDLHVHAGGAPKNPDAEYPYKLWLAHGVTTVRGVPLTDNALAVKEKDRSARNEIVAPRIYNYQRPGSGWGKGVPVTAENAHAWVEWAHANGVDGIKLGAERPDLMEIYCQDARKLGMGTTAHLQQTGVVQVNAIKAARMGLGTVTHFYGHFESLLKDYVVQPYPVTQNYNNEQDRFSQVARLWDKIHPPGSPEWKAYLEEHLKLGTTFDPTLTIYSAGRDVMRFRAAEWHDKFTLPSLMTFYTPDRQNHGAYWYDWTTEDEVAFRNFYQVWFKLMNDYKKMGGRVTTGFRLRLHLPDLRLRLHQRVRAPAGGRLPSARSHPVGDDERRADFERSARRFSPGARIRRRARGHAGRHGRRRSEPAAELQGALRERHDPAERQDREGRTRRRREMDDQGRHRVRREEARRRRPGDGRKTEARNAEEHDRAVNLRISDCGLRTD